MGRSFDPNESLNRPDLNQCPDCGCFFAQEKCPLCGKICPEEMRAGNRKPVKKSRSKSRGPERVTFVEWYHAWWFIIAMLYLFPVAGLVLFATSPHKKTAKIIFLAVIAVLMFFFTFAPLIAFWIIENFF